ncbi:RICIN domain-containing protein [Ideonella sp. BN130291]|uniref:RICIN domain-containing protein n=1 Tax=Ideonella sp. BN130291 TaxID=3112940 RepID=UPI002E26ECA5|nr:RICIN domain-containing protein [Ideonella sp. BN130291]
MRKAFITRLAVAFGALPLILAACGGGSDAGSTPAASTSATGRARALAEEAATTKIVAEHSGKCLNVEGGPEATQDGARIIQWACNGASNEDWTLVSDGNGHVSLVARSSNKCVQPAGGGTANETKLEQASCNGSAQQLWTVRPKASGGRYEIVHLNAGRCLDVTGGPAATADGVVTELWDCTGEANQSWALEAGGGGGGGGGGGQVLPQLNNGDTNWTLTFQDEFDGADLDRSKWSPQFGWLADPEERNWVVEDSKLKMWSRKDPAQGKFYDRNIHTADKWYGGYGYYEARMKLNVGPGQWPAFWLYNNAQWPSFAPEIDIMEAYAGCDVEPWSVPGTCEPGTFEAAVHRSDNETRVFTGGNANGGGSNRTQPGYSLASGFHTYGALYDETGVTLFLDGQQVGKLSGNMPASLFMILSLQNDPNRPDPSGEPVDDNNDWRNTKQNAFEIEYVRAWKRP